MLALPVLLFGWLLVFAWLSLYAKLPELNDETLVIAALLGISLPLYVVWFAWGVNRAAAQCLAFLSEPNRGEQSLRLDHSLAAAPASDRELLSALLACILPGLWWRVLLGSALAVAAFWTGLTLLAPLADLVHDWLWLVTASFLLMLVTGTIAALNSVLIWVICGYGTYGGIPRTLGAGVQTMCQLAWVPLVLALNKHVLGSLIGFSPRLVDQWEFGAVAQFIGLSVFLTIVALYFLLRITLAWPGMGAWLMLGLLPLLFAGGVAGGTLALLFAGGVAGGTLALRIHPIWIGYLATGGGLTSLLDLNAVVFGPAFDPSLPFGQQLGAVGGIKALVLLAQAGLACLLWDIALKAIHLKRGGAV